MKTSIEALNQFVLKYSEDWKQILDDYLKYDDEVSEEACQYIDNFISACREDIISNNHSNWKALEERIDNDLLYKNLYNCVKESLSAYYITAPLRALEAQDAGKAEKVVREIFDRAILRFDIKVVEKYEKYGFTSQEALLEFMNVLDNFCSFMVERNFYYTTIERYVWVNMRFSKEMCKQMAEIIDENFQQLKINYIIDKLKTIDVSEK